LVLTNSAAFHENVETGHSVTKGKFYGSAQKTVAFNVISYGNAPKLSVKPLYIWYETSISANANGPHDSALC